MSDYTKSLTELLKSYSVDTATGRTSRQAAAALQKYGENSLPGHGRAGLKNFLPRVMGTPVLVLGVAAAASFVSALLGGGRRGYIDSIIITLLIIVNGILNFLPEYRARKSFSELKSMSAPVAKVLRNGEPVAVPAELVTPGDVLLLEAGDLIPADGRLLEASSLVCDESVLSELYYDDNLREDGAEEGESPPEKDPTAEVAEGAAIPERLNMVYSGCTVTHGRARAIVTATGGRTELARMSVLPEETDEPTPTQFKLTMLGRRLSLLTLCICAAIFVLGIIRRIELATLFVTSLSLAVAALPAGLGAVVTAILARAARDMLNENIIVRKHAAIETLGATSVICSDKTGVLTDEHMTVTRVWTPGVKILETGEGAPLPERARHVLRLGALCSNVDPLHGDPTEDAIISAASAAGMEKNELDRDFRRVAELPFDSSRGLMTTVHEVGGKLISVTKGGCDLVLQRCPNADNVKARDVNRRLTKNALRVIAVACRELDRLPKELNPEELEHGLVFMGLLGMSEPPREETVDALERCRAAGIKTVMITGDSVRTAAAAAVRLGIISDESQAITGPELREMQDWELEEAVGRYGVFARIRPEDRLRIVRAWQDSGEVVAMTGDSVYDAPALIEADVGCATGGIGSDAARQAADMVLMDNSFSALESAVEIGRAVSDNIKKAAQFMLGSNLGEILAVLLAMLFGWGLPVLAEQLLLVNALTCVFPAIALGAEKPDKTVMRVPPPPRDEGIFADGAGALVIMQGVTLGILTLAGYAAGAFAPISGVLPPTREIGVTMAFLVMALSQISQAYNCRSRISVFKTGIFGNKSLNRAALCSLALVLASCLVPALAGLFGLTSISMLHWLVAIGLSLAPLCSAEIFKMISGARRLLH